MPKATHRLKRFNRKKHKNGQFRHRPLTIREVEKAQRGFLLTKEEAAIVSGRCRQCRVKTYKHGHLDGCDRSACSWRRTPFEGYIYAEPLVRKPFLPPPSHFRCCHRPSTTSLLSMFRLARPSPKWFASSQTTRRR